MNRKQRADIAQETLQILEDGFYYKNELRIDITKELKSSVENTMLYKPDDFKDVKDNLKTERNKTEIEVTNESTLEAAHRVAKNCKNVTCLNFASAKNPGGGFIGGSQAQEEVLVRSSGLYSSLIENMEYYEYNRNRTTCI